MNVSLASCSKMLIKIVILT